MDVTSHLIRLPDGRNLEYMVATNHSSKTTRVPDSGASKAPTSSFSPSSSSVIVAMHGFGETCGMFMCQPLLDVYERLGISKLISISMPGCGHSSVHPFRLVENWGEDVEHVLEKENVHEFDVFGLSAGGMHAIAIANKYVRNRGDKTVSSDFRSAGGNESGGGGGGGDDGNVMEPSARLQSSAATASTMLTTTTQELRGQSSRVCRRMLLLAPTCPIDAELDACRQWDASMPVPRNRTEMLQHEALLAKPVSFGVRMARKLFATPYIGPLLARVMGLISMKTRMNMAPDIKQGLRKLEKSRRPELRLLRKELLKDGDRACVVTSLGWHHNMRTLNAWSRHSMPLGDIGAKLDSVTVISTEDDSTCPPWMGNWVYRELAKSRTGGNDEETGEVADPFIAQPLHRAIQLQPGSSDDEDDHGHSQHAARVLVRENDALGDFLREVGSNPYLDDAASSPGDVAASPDGKRSCRATTQFFLVAKSGYGHITCIHPDIVEVGLRQAGLV